MTVREVDATIEFRDITIPPGSDAPILRCKNCEFTICTANDLCFYAQNPASIHLTLKIERSKIANDSFTVITDKDRNKFIASTVYCKGCNDPIGNESLIGPKRLGVFCFSSSKVVFYFPTSASTELFTRKDWATFQIKYSKWIEHRSFENFYPSSMTSANNLKGICSINTNEDEVTPLVYPTVEIMQHINPNSLTKSNPRPYQIELLLTSSLSNTIVYLPTGCGKTLVAAMFISLMKHLNPKRLCIFLVTKVPLAYQQCNYLAQETCLQCVVLCGESKQEIYFNDIYSYDIVVFTAQVFLNYLTQGRISLSRISCIVLDEVHHTTGSTPFALFFDNHYDQFADHEKPLIMGLTASPFEVNVDAQKSMARLNELCTHIWCDLSSPIVYYRDMVEYCSAPNASYFLIKMNEIEALFECKLESYVQRIFKNYHEYFDISSPTHSQEWSTSSNIKGFINSMEERVGLSDEQLTIIHHIKQIYCAVEALQIIGFVEAYEYLDEIIRIMRQNIDFPWSIEDAKILFDLREQFKTTNGEYSNRFKALVEILTGDDVEPDSKMLIFVKARKTARWLTKRLKENKLVNAQWNPECIVGQGGGTIDGMNWKEQQRPIISNFHKGITRLLIATNVIQEGIDVPSCDCVIHFDIVDNVTQLVQSRGRARYKSSDFILICSEAQRDQCLEVFQKEVKTKRLVENYLLENVKRQEKSELFAYLACLTQMIYNARHLPAEKRTSVPFKMVHKSKFSKSIVIQMLNLTESQLPQILSFAESNLIYKYISEPVEDQQFCGNKTIEIDCLIPDVDNRSICHIFLKIFDSLHETYPDLMYCMRRKISSLSLDVDAFSLECFGMHFGALSQPYSFASFHHLNENICLLLSFQSKMIRVFLFSIKFFMIEIPFSSLDAFIQLSLNDGIVNFIIPFIRTPLLYESPIPACFGTARCPDMKELIEGYVGFQWVRTSSFSCLPFDIFEKAFCLNLNMFLNEEVKLQTFYSLNMFEKVGISVHFIPSIQIVSVKGSSTSEFLVELTQRFGFDVSFEMACFITTCAPYVTGQLDDDFFQQILQHSNKRLLIFLANELLKFYLIPTNRYFPIGEFLQKAFANFSSISPSEIAQFTPLNSCHVKFVTITPTRIIYSESKLMNSNRLLRHFGPDNFVRVHFRDENLHRLSVSQSYYPMNLVFDRLSTHIRNGIMLCGITFELLAMSSSQLRNHGCWFYNASLPLSANNIRSWLGDFSRIRNVAKYVARLGQSLSASVEYSDKVGNETLAFDEIPDVLKHLPSIHTPTISVEYNFTDGIGCISPHLMQIVSSNFGLTSIPSALQIRIGGYKGVVSVYPKIDQLGTSPLLLRPSMCKFESKHKKLDILNFSEYIPCYLNRQVIIIMSALGVADESFERLQNEMLIGMIDVLVNENALLLYLTSNYKCPYFTAKELQFNRDNSKIPYTSEPFFRALAICAYKAQLTDLLNKSRIYLPKGRILMGVIDEAGILGPNEVFVQCSVDSRDSFDNYATFPTSTVDHKTRFVVTANVCIAKNPCMHPGDIRTVRAVHNEFLASFMFDVIVFPKTGTIPIPTMCSGSDLDGDLYFVTWDPALIPCIQEEPLPYLELGQQTVTQDAPIEMGQVADFMINFIKNDQLGVIANSHVAHSDQKELGVRDPLCKTLAGLFSLAVDFPKTGFVATLPDDAKVKEYPDFMQKPHFPSYESSKVIGKMYRKVREIGTATKLLKTKSISIDDEYLVEGFEEYLDSASKSFFAYESSMKDIMRRYGITHECEILSNSLMQNDMIGSEDKKDVMKLVSILVQELRLKTRQSFFSDEITQNPQEALKKASAWYYVAYSQAMNAGILSFPWLVEDILMTIKHHKLNSFSEILSKSLLDEFHSHNSRYSTAHQLIERIDLFKRIESVVSTVDPRLHCKLFGSTVTLMFDLMSDLNILIDHFATEKHQEPLLQALRKEFSNQIQVSNCPISGDLVFKGQGSTFEFCISFQSNGAYDDTVEVLSFFNEFPTSVPLMHFIIRVSRYMGILKKISSTMLCTIIIRCIYHCFPELRRPSYCLFTVSFLAHLLSTVESNKANYVIQDWNCASILFKILSFLSDERKVVRHIPTLNPSLCNSFFTIYNLLVQSVSIQSVLDCIRTTYDSSNTFELIEPKNSRRVRLMMKGFRSGFFVAGSSKLLFENSKSRNDLVHFEIYQAKKRPSHMDMNCFAPLLSYGTSDDVQRNLVEQFSNIDVFAISDKIVYDEFYQVAFRQFTFLRDNYSVDKFGDQIVARIKLGSIYVTTIPKIFVQESLSCTVENVQLALSKGYRAIDLDFEDIFSKSQAFLDSFRDEGKDELTQLNSSVAAEDNPVKDLEALKQIIDKNNQKTAQIDAQTELKQKELKRKKSKKQGPMNSSFESWINSFTPIALFLEQYRFNLAECVENSVSCFVVVPARSNPKATIHLIVMYDSSMKFIEANYAPLKWIQLDVVTQKNGDQFNHGTAMNESFGTRNAPKTDFRLNVTTLKKLDLPTLQRMIPDEHFESITNGRVVAFDSSKELCATELFKLHTEQCFCRKSIIKRYVPSEETQLLLQQAFPQFAPYFESEIFKRLCVKLVSTSEYSFPDPNTGKFTIGVEKYEVEPRIKLEESDIKNSLFYDELINILWAMGKFYSKIVNE